MNLKQLWHRLTVGETRASGLDISSWEYTYTPTTNPPRPVNFAIQRLSYGMMVDSRMEQLWPGVSKALAKGAFHYASSAAPMAEQSKFFLCLFRQHPYDFFALDIEKGYNGATTDFINGIIPFMNTMMQTGKPGLLYVNPDTWNTWLKPVQAQLVKYDLWVAQYWLLRNSIAPYLAPGMRKDWRMWQWDDNGMGGQGHAFGVASLGLDLDVYNGSMDDMLAWLHKETPPPTYPLYKVYVPGGQAANVRIGPMESSAITGYALNGSLLQVDTIDSINKRSHYVNWKGATAPASGWIWSDYLVKV